MALGSLVEPAALLRLDSDAADELLDRLEAAVPVHPRIVQLASTPAPLATVFGDSHGDWHSMLAATSAFRSNPTDRLVIGLGDYVDRTPSDCAEGSVANALYLLELVAAHPDRVYLLQGNHETHRTIPVHPHDLPEEVDLLWGPVEERYLRLRGLLERGPLALTVPSGVYFAHGGFPLTPPSDPFPAEFDPMGEDSFAEVVWGEAAAARTHRGFVRPFDEPDLDRFLVRCGRTMFVRGHDPELTGRPIYHGHCLTLHTSRLFERYGGVIVADIPLDRPVRSASDLTIRHLATEGQVYPPPA